MSVKLLLKLKPEFWHTPPYIQFEIDGELHTVENFKISNEVVTYNFQIDDRSSHQIKIKRFGKTMSLA